MRERELRSPGEARRSLTKFMTIIIIALSLEAVVGIFEVGREKNFEALLYPAAVMAVAVLALIRGRRLPVPEPACRDRADRPRGGRACAADRSRHHRELRLPS